MRRRGMVTSRTTEPWGVFPILLMLLALLASRPVPARAQPEPAWKTIAEEEGMRIEARAMPETALREIRVQTHSALAPETIFAVIWNVAAQHEFVPNLKVLRVLRSSEDEVLVYERVKIPVVQDRDYVLRLTKHIAPQTRVHQVFARGASELGPPPERGVVRMTRLASHFTIAPARQGGSEVTYVSFGDPAGKVPAWIIRAADVRGPRDFVRALLKRALALQRE